MAQGVRADGLGHASAAGDTPYDSGSAVPVEALTVDSGEDRPSGTLANGQVWVQGEAWTAMPVSVGDTISIKPGALGSFRLYAPSGIAIWVTRAR